MNEVVREFLLETNENLAQLALDLVTVERSPTERETLARVFRTLHTVKGTAGFLGLPRLQAVAHAAENLLSRLRSGELAFQGDIATVLLAVVDVIRQMLASIEVSEAEGAGDDSELIQTLERLTRGSSVTGATQVSTPAPALPTPPKVRATSMAEYFPPSMPEQSLIVEVSESAEPRASSVSDSSIR